MKNQGGKKKQMQIQKIESHELFLILLILTGLFFIFSVVNKKRKSRHQW